MAGYTSGAAAQAYKQLAEQGEFDENSLAIILFPDHGSRYMTKVFSDDWMAEQGFTNSRLNGLEARATVERVK